MSAIKVFGDGTSTIYQLLGGKVPSPACGGNGTCGKCRVRTAGEVSKPSTSEERFLSREELDSGTRLACLCVPRGECLVDMQEASGSFGIVSAYDVPPFTFSGEGYGIAVDIGTTTCVMDLVDLATGCVLARESFLNGQRAWGADVLSRVQASVTGHSEDLREAILSGLLLGLKRLIERADTLAIVGPAATADTPVVRQSIVPSRMVIAANTAMCHFLLGLNANGLGLSPFTPEATVYPDRSLADLLGEALTDVRLSPCVVRIVPGVSAFIGGDIIAGLAALDFGVENSRPSAFGAAELFLDIGTNAEMVLIWDGKYLCASAAAGPAFEGGGISCGTGCVSGAVSSVFVEKNRFGYHLIGDTGKSGAAGSSPAGLCGSGLIDFIACSLELGLIRPDGSLSPVCAETGILLEPDGTITLTQKDIREFQLSKAAVRAGIEVLLSSFRRIRAGLKRAKRDCDGPVASRLCRTHPSGWKYLSRRRHEISRRSIPFCPV